MHKLFLCAPLISAALCLLTPDTAAQTALAHFDKPFYVGGETVWFKLYLPAGAQGRESSVRLQIVSPLDGTVGEVFLPTEKKGCCQGYFQLPFELGSGYYVFAFSAKRADGQTEELLRAEVPVYDDSRPTAKTSEPTETPPSKPLANGGLQISAHWADGAVGTKPRSPAKLALRVTDDFGNPVQAECSVSIADDGLCGPAAAPFPSIFSGASNQLSPEKWVGGIYCSGILRDGEGRLLSANLVPVLDVDAQQVLFGKAEQGAMLFQTPMFEGQRRLQVVGLPETHMQAQWQQEPAAPSNKPLPMTEGLARYMEWSKKRKKIYQLHKTTEWPSAPKPQPPAPPQWKANQTVRVQDYERFPDMAALFRELIWRVKFTEKNGRYSASMYSADSQKDFPEPPLFLLDGIATYDADFVARLDPTLVETIELLHDPKLLRKHFPAIGGGGVVRIRSLAGTMPQPQGPVGSVRHQHGAQAPMAFPAVPADPGLPALRPVVHWSPSVRTSPQGTAEIAYVHTDDKGRFCAEIVAQGPDGRRGHARICLEVK